MGAAGGARRSLAALPDDPVVINVNVPNRPLDEMAGWRRTEVALLPPRTLASAALTPKVGHDDAFDVRMEWGDPHRAARTTPTAVRSRPGTSR